MVLMVKKKTYQMVFSYLIKRLTKTNLKQRKLSMTLIEEYHEFPLDEKVEHACIPQGTLANEIQDKWKKQVELTSPIIY